jgi:sugar transferase (PEP-CTERM/EpsH1 system associated)
MLITFTEHKADIQHKDALNHLFERVETVHLPWYLSMLQCLRVLLLDPTPLQVLYFRSRAMKKCIQKVLGEENIDAVHVQHLRMSQYVHDLQGLPAILDLPDAYSLYWKRRAKLAHHVFSRWFNQFEYQRVFKYESKILPQFKKSLACSVEDVKYLTQHHQINDMSVFPNGVDLDTFKAENHDYSGSQILLFTGNMNYAPNVDAVIYFAREMFPTLQNQYPGLKFIIAGQKPVSKVRQLANDSIIITGFVKDLSEYYRKAAVVVAPLRIGAGTQNKVLEAMAMGVPVVCSEIGFDGLGIQSGEGVFKETTKETFIQRVSSLLEDQQVREITGKKGQEVIHEKFDWNILSKQLEKHFKSLLAS